MKGKTLDLARAARFVESLGQAASSAAVGERMQRLIEACGFFGAACGDVIETPTGPRATFYFNTWPESWLKTYRERDFVRLDPAPLLARLTATPFTWVEMRESRGWSTAQQAFHAWLDGIGVIDAYTLPIHLPGHDFGLCVCVADHRLEDVHESHALHLACYYAYQRCREFGQEFQASTVKAPLSARETDCLRLVLKGKSDKEIARELDIAPTTVHFHVERVKKKLGVKSRSQAAAAIVALGYLSG